MPNVFIKALGELKCFVSLVYSSPLAKIYIRKVTFAVAVFLSRDYEFA